MRRYPYTACLLALAGVLASILWMLTHEACSHPLSNLAAFAMLCVLPVALVDYVSGGTRQGGDGE